MKKVDFNKLQAGDLVKVPRTQFAPMRSGWKELGLMKPLEPEQTAQYKFSDLQMSLYYTIYI